MTPHLAEPDWRSLAEQASNEMDPVKLSILVSQLCRVLDDRDEKSGQRRLTNNFGPSLRIGCKAGSPS